MNSKSAFWCGKRTPSSVNKVRYAIIIFVTLYLSVTAILGHRITWLTLEPVKFLLEWRDHGLDQNEVSQKHIRNILRRDLLEDDGGKALRLRLIHRHSQESPVRKNSATRAEKLEELVAADAERMKGFSQFLGSLQSSYVSENIVAAALSAGVAPSPSPNTEFQLQVPMISGSAVAGNIALYFVELSIGTPGQTFLFIADTGSDLIWVPCNPCTTCNNSRRVFIPSNSSTFASIPCSSEECNLVPAPFGATCSPSFPNAPCQYDYIYGDRSETTGIFAYETFTMADQAGRNVRTDLVAFGCGTNNTGPSFRDGSSGVIGLGQGIVSFTSQIGYMYGNKFSHCFVDFFHSGTAHSFLVFGSRSRHVHVKEPMQYTPFVKNPLSQTYYYVGIENLTVAGYVLPIHESVWTIDMQTGNGGTVVDSGSTLTSFRQPAYRVIRTAFEKAVSYPQAAPTASLDLCYSVPNNTKLELPEFSIRFKGGSVFRPPMENIFLSPREGLRCLGFRENSSPFGMSIIGNLLQQNFHVEYDRAKNRLGFARADCSAQT